MNLLGYLCVFLFAVAVCFGQNVTDTTADTTPKSETTQKPDTSSKPDTTQNPITTQNPVTTQSPATTQNSTTTVKPDTTPDPVTTPVPASTSTKDQNDTTPVGPVTTSVAPETTQTSNDTSTVITTQTTNDTTTVGPTTTPSPAPSPDLKFDVTENNVTCILAQMEITISVNYATENGYKLGEIQLHSNDATLNTEKSTDCNTSSSVELLVINFDQTSEITFNFTKDGSKISVNNLVLELVNLKTIFNDSSVDNMTLQYGSALFETTNGFSYLCNAETKADLAYSNGTSSGSSMKFQKVQVQAFNTDSRKDFLTAKECTADDNVSDIVPIAVGCALAGLVVIVLIAYLVGRRQKRQRGYESV